MLPQERVADLSTRPLTRPAQDEVVGLQTNALPHPEQRCAAPRVEGSDKERRVEASGGLDPDRLHVDVLVEVLQAAATRYAGVRVMPFRRNGGSGTARRIGTQQARGEIVVWTDTPCTGGGEALLRVRRR